MSLAIETDPVPLKLDSDGVVRVGGTRVTLETLVTAYQLGATPEEIAQQYPAVSLPDIHAVISFYLRRKATVPLLGLIGVDYKPRQFVLPLVLLEDRANGKIHAAGL